MENKGVNDPMELLREMNDLRVQYGRALDKLSDMCAGTVSRTVNNWDARERVLGPKYLMAKDKWMGQKVKIQERWALPAGYVIALHEVGTLYLLGVEFDTPIRGGYGLALKTSGILGREVSCLWLWPSQVTILGLDKDSGTV